MSVASRQLAVIMERRTLQNRWVDHQWEAIAVLPDMEATAPRCLLQDSQTEQWLYPALPLQLHADEADNYFLNLSAPQPCIFVVTREQDGRPAPAFLTVSYGEAARMLDAGETVDTIALPEALREWVTDFATAHFRAPEPKREKGYARTRQKALQP